MTITSISVTYRRTFNLGDFNNAVFEETISADLDNGDDDAAAQAALWQMARSSVQAQALPVVRPREEKLKAAFDTLPDEVKDAILRREY